MAISASFHRNVLLLSQVIQPSDELKKYFREGMFDKPNTAGFLHISHYLLTVYDSERFKKLIEWPVLCKKTEAKYRNNVKDYLIVISAENPDIGFPNIHMSHLIHAGGSKFTIIMWKLSQVVTRRYIMRETTYNVIFAPQIGNKGNITKQFLQETNIKINCNILSQHKNLSKMKDLTKSVIEKETQTLDKIIAEIFEKELLIGNLSQTAPVHDSIKKYLRDINNEEIIKTWKMNISKNLNQFHMQNKALKGIEQLVYKVNNIIINNNSDIKIFNAKQLQKINHLEISELFPPNMQCLLFRLYKDDKLMLNNFILLLNFSLTQLQKRLKLNILEDFSECLLQIEASYKDIKAAFNIIQTYLVEITKMISETQDIVCQKITQIHDDDVLPMMNNIVIMSSPLIKIDTNCSDEGNNLQKRLQLTPVEAPHKSLFLRYKRLKQDYASHGSKLRGNLLVSRINFEDSMTNINHELPSLHMNMMLSKKNILSSKQAEKYSRLFSTRMKKNNVAAANSSIASVPCSSKANSTVLTNAIEEMHDISEFSLNTSTKSLCNINAEFATPEKLTAKQDKSENMLEMEDIANDFLNKANVLDICETIETGIKNNGNNINKTKQNRHYIGDLVARYKKVVERRNRTSSPKISYVEYDNKEL
ncbi:hypothetical protein E2986_10314 [Frieseomelitta varia]|uniref:HAUS augmin-like complex subunit 6 N-terminal domain-containing protein n=2 Tax=Frieseomelitta varia TaxID=561572 RepID=A0A833R5I8_9HYME|nr:uncharacterized protein LOC122536885 isoform X1 [Frieseomelitta varia]KAF3421279.1 hypothetical protein E2986_10314 [Frieseomelitta varia]